MFHLHSRLLCRHHSTPLIIPRCTKFASRPAIVMRPTLQRFLINYPITVLKYARVIISPVKPKSFKRVLYNILSLCLCIFIVLSERYILLVIVIAFLVVILIAVVVTCINMNKNLYVTII